MAQMKREEMALRRRDSRVCTFWLKMLLVNEVCPHCTKRVQRSILFFTKIDDFKKIDILHTHKLIDH